MTNEQSALMQTVDSLGIPPEQCDPKVNILTFNKWKEQGRMVRKGEKTCARVSVFVEKKGKIQKNGKAKKSTFRKTACLFHITQTDAFTPKGDDIKPDNQFLFPTESVPKTIKNLSSKLNELADKLQGQIDNKLADRLTNTPKRQQQASYARLEGEHLQRTQTALYKLANMHDSETIPECLQDIKSKKDVHELTRTEKESTQGHYYGVGVCTGKPRQDTEQTRAIFALLTPKSEAEKKAESLAKRIDDLQFSNIPGYFPTPKPVIDLMIEKADLVSHLRVLEPSAGHGAICDELKAYSVHVSTFEINHTLSGILFDKRINVIGADFMSYEGGDKFDRVIMNPPFERLQDIDHVMHAFSMLGEMGRLVAIMSPAFTFRNDKKCEAFRDFVSMHGSYEQLPDNSFKSSGTGVNTVIVTLDK